MYNFNSTKPTFIDFLEELKKLDRHKFIDLVLSTVESHHAQIFIDLGYPHISIVLEFC